MCIYVCTVASSNEMQFAFLPFSAFFQVGKTGLFGPEDYPIVGRNLGKGETWFMLLSLCEVFCARMPGLFSKTYRCLSYSSISIAFQDKNGSLTISPTKRREVGKRRWKLMISIFHWPQINGPNVLLDDSLPTEVPWGVGHSALHGMSSMSLKEDQILQIC